MRCARHPNVETGLTCSRCNTPICPDCLVPGAVGMLCRQCGNKHASPVYKIHPARFALALVAGLGAGTLVGYLIQFVNFFICFIGPLLGGLLGDLVLRLTGFKRGPWVMFLVGASVFGGTVIAVLTMGGFGRLIASPLSLAYFGLGLFLTAGAAFARVRF